MRIMVTHDNSLSHDRQSHSRYGLSRHMLSYDTYILSRYIRSITGLYLLRPISHGTLSVTIYLSRVSHTGVSYNISLTVYITLSFRFRTLSLTCDGDATVLAPPFADDPFLSFSHNTSESGNHHRHHALHLMLRKTPYR